MPKETFPRDRFDEVSAQRGRVGVHRAENPGMRAGVVLLWAIAATLVLIAAGVFGTLVASGRIDFTPKPTPTSTPEPAITPVIDTSFDVLILNATPKEGIAGQVADDVVAAGWEADQVTDGGAGSQDFKTTTVFYPTPDDEAAAAGLADAIGGAEIQESADYLDYLQRPDQKLLTIVIGLDRVETPSPSPTE